MFSTPTVVGDNLFIGSCAGKFYALDKTTGRIRWTYDIHRDGNQKSFHGDPLVIGDRIIIGTDYSCDPKGIGHVYSFKTTTGQLRWKHRSTGVPTDIIRQGSRVFFGTFHDDWSLLDLESGKVQWTFSSGLTNPECVMIHSATAAESRLFLSSLDGTVYALDAETGKVIFKRVLPATPTTSLVFRDKSLYVGTEDQKLLRLDARTGMTITELRMEATPTGKLSFAEGRWYVFLENRPQRQGYLAAVDGELTAVVWKTAESPTWASGRPHFWKSYVVAGNCRGEVAAFNASDGRPEWTLKVPGCVRSIGDSRDMLFAGVQEGTVFAFRLE